ncbi:isoprenoid biosynthesis glyoxalase ElbB [Alkalimonas collagenimarina]|uniref:Glyoxalase n=1 Tax=Alkalimonas collagenimarina TaxID=400390 RepID=A0ABT9GY52_9GAMM|nr:isoprenoid biosynthesis glyoxalase ElbB [Alkalimonas collagenimarina]MDP4535986.1 isoprenoid biosynthesis glyoxalase ElbB [Alkalimonas collagenimarina]
MKHVAVILSGCGVYDGAEIHESVLTLLHLEQQHATYQCFAPDTMQHHVINHVTGEASNEQRNVLIEAARIARGQIKPLSALQVDDFDAVILPGGFGAAKNLSDFAFAGAKAEVLPELKQHLSRFIAAKKPLGFICIAPAMIPRLFDSRVSLTIGMDQDTADHITTMGGQHINCRVQDIVVDHAAKVVSTPAYMLAQSVLEASSGIEKLVHAVLELAEAKTASHHGASPSPSGSL